MFVVQERKTKLYHGYCHTVGDDIWFADVNHKMVEKYKTIQSVKWDMNWVPWYWWLTRYKIVEI
jgi:hypothetical protein